MEIKINKVIVPSQGIGDNVILDTGRFAVDGGNENGENKQSFEWIHAIMVAENVVGLSTIIILMIKRLVQS